MIYLYALGDLHLTDTPVRSCRLSGTEFLAEQVRRLSEVVDRVRQDLQRKERRPSWQAVLLPGDLIDKWRSSPAVLAALSSFLLQLAQMDVSVIATLGQHDVRGHDMENWKRNSYLPLLGSEHFRVLVDDGYDPGPISLFGASFDGDPYRFDDCQYPMADVTLWHVSASNEPNPTTADIRNLPMPGPIVVCGDIHNFSTSVRVPSCSGYTRVFSAGSLIPMNNGDQNSRPPKSCGFWVLQVEDAKVVTSDFVLFSKQQESYFDPEIREVFESPEHLLQNVEEMAEHVHRMREETSLSDIDIVRRLAHQYDVEMAVVDHLLSHLEETQ